MAFPAFRVRISGEATVQMFIDTGATRTVITPRIQQRLGLDVTSGEVEIAGGRIVPAGRTVLSSIEFSGFPETSADNLAVRVLQVSLFDGVLGIDYLSRFANVCHDFVSNTLELTTR